jgi:RNA polymerase sigma-70 factor, ECF subfamily
MNPPVAALGDAALSTLLRSARAGSIEALGELFEACRGYLLTVARHRLAASLRAKVDPADVVQQTFIEALRDFSSFRGEAGRQLLVWLRCILRHNLSDLCKHFESHCRCVAQEVPLFDQQRLAAAPARQFLAVGGPICEQLIAQEQRRALNAALLRLPPLYRQVVQLHFGEHCTFSEIGNTLQRSPEAVRKMAGRAVERLRQEMRVHACA